jgi:hypothetical protein
MEELMNMLVSPDESSSQISDKIKDILFAKSAENIEAIRPNVASSIFDDSSVEDESEVDSEE